MRLALYGKYKKTESEAVLESLHRLFSTYPGEYVRNTYGSRIRELLFEPKNINIMNIGSAHIYSAITQYEKRVTIKSINIDASKSKFIIILSINNDTIAVSINV